MANFSIPLLPIDRSSRQKKKKINIETLEWNDTINQMYLKDKNKEANQKVLQI
jgi:hypothetical protein